MKDDLQIWTMCTEIHALYLLNYDFVDVICKPSIMRDILSCSLISSSLRLSFSLIRWRNVKNQSACLVKVWSGKAKRGRRNRTPVYHLSTRWHAQSHNEQCSLTGMNGGDVPSSVREIFGFNGYVIIF